MAKLLTIDEWLDKTFSVTSRPSKKTVYRWVAKDPTMARRMGGRLYMLEGAGVPQTTAEQAEVARIASKM